MDVPFQSISLFFYKITKMKIKSFECPKSIRNYENNTLNVRCLFEKSFVPLAKQTKILYYRLSNFWTIKSTDFGILICNSFEFLAYS